jgi:DNA-binding beta-propeller fold protein YncE
MKTNHAALALKLTRPLLAAAGIILLAAGCATSPKNAGPKYAFYPPAPNAPRLQYLASFGSEKDLRGNSGNNFYTFITGSAPPNTPIMKPYGAAATTNNFYVCDTGAGLILRLDLAARRFFAIAPTGPASLKSPVNLSVDDNGWVYVADSLLDQVVIVDDKENYVATLGEKGKTKPRDVIVGRDRIYMADIAQHAVHVYDKATRAPLFDIPRGAEATNLNSKLFQPINLALDAKGQIYVGDFGAYRVQVFDADGKYVRTVGKYGDNYGEFARLKGIAVDHDGLLYAVDAAGQVVELFDSAGRLLMWFGEPGGSRFGLDLPAKVVVDYDNVAFFQKYAAPDFSIEYLVIVTNQYGPRKVSVFGFGHKK